MTMSKRSPLALAVLSLLEEAPMHPYRMQQLITSRGKDKVINVSQRASLYSTIDRLTREGLVRVAETERDGQRPERNVYEITDDGRATAYGWLTDMLSVPRRSFPDFYAALAHAPMLTPESLAELLETRRGLVAAEVDELRNGLAAVEGFLPRVVLLDTELILQTRATEVAFLDNLLADLRSGAVTWSRESLTLLSQTHEPHP
ncbi:hypothetical protein AL755_19120 [Arthrobacter sp. ERGS1:01]|nr:hypothetical protein AL755_19120 [Arthrobacter sp. ERGS1:01]